MTQSTEPPYTCSVGTVVWEEGHREMSPYPGRPGESCVHGKRRIKNGHSNETLRSTVVA